MKCLISKRLLKHSNVHWTHTTITHAVPIIGYQACSVHFMFNFGPIFFPPKLSNFLQYPLSLGFTKKTHIFSNIKIYTNTFFGTLVHEVWQSIRSINLSYLLWSLLRSSWKWKCFSSSGHRESVISSSGHCESESVFSSSGHCESKCVSIDVYQNWSNLILTFDIDQFLPLWKGVDTGWIG